MNKKSLIMIFIIAILVLLTIVTINYKNIKNVFWKWIGNINFEMIQTEKYGPIGTDIKFVLGDGKFQLIQTQGENFDLIIKQDEALGNSLLRECTKYKYVKNKQKLYVISDKEGYGVVDGFTNQCKLFITVPSEKFVSGYSIDNQGVKHIQSRFLNDEHIKYLNSYDDFNIDEKTIFEKIKK